MGTNFTNDKMTNPFSKSATFTSTASTSASSAPCVFVTETTTTTASDSYTGSVIVIVNKADKTFKIIGVDGDGAELSNTEVK